MNPSTIEIHEFSTGIRPERTADGGWVSRGFTGQYMNRTIASIPFVVERSIANREFALTEGASRERPAIIGREVGSGDDGWSVVAVVTRGRDEFGRSGSFYRYFLCEGNHNLWKILAWWNSEKCPTFNPFDTKVIGQPNFYDGQGSGNQQLPSAESLSNTPTPLLLQPEQQDDIQIINKIAIRKANDNGQPVSWAFNVEALEQPRRFQVIQAASDRAYQILQKAIANVPQVLTPVVADEEALKSAIRSLMNSSQVKSEAVQTIVEALGNDQITSEYWHTLFDGQGAKTAITQKIYSPQMVRLVTLRAMVISETLPEFLDWLNIKGCKNKRDDNQTVSLEFQSAFRELFPKEKLADGITLLLPKLLEQQITPEAVSWLLTEQQSAWAHCRSQFLADVRADLDLVRTYFNFPRRIAGQVSDPFNCGNKIWQILINQFSNIKDNSKQRTTYYEPLTEFFNYIEDYCLSAYFYQVSYGEVPKKVFLSAFPGTRKYCKKHLGIFLYRRITFFEIIFALLTKETIVPIQIVILLLLITFAGGLVMGKVFLGQPLSPTQTANRGEQPEISTDKGVDSDNQGTTFTGKDQIGSQNPVVNLPAKSGGSNLAPKMTESDKQKALKQFPQTSTVIVKIVKELKNELGEPEETIQNALKEVLQEPSLDYSGAIITTLQGHNYSVDAQIKWVEAIYTYQKKHNPTNALGYMNSPDAGSGKVATYENLKTDIKNYLQKGTTQEMQMPPGGRG